MDWACKAVLTGLSVAAVMMAARLLGRGAAGLLAGLPVISAPALVWLAAERGVEQAAHSAVGGLAACAAAPLFALVYAQGARRHGTAGALLRALTVLIVCLAALKTLHGQPGALLGLALLSAAWARHRLKRGLPPGEGPVRALRGEPWLSASLAGGVSAASGVLASGVGPFWSGAVAALPLISAFALVHLHRAGSPGDTARFGVSYAPGVAAKAVFLFTFALLAVPLGVVGALVLSAVAGAGVAWRACRPRGPRPAAPATTADMVVGASRPR